MAPLKQKLEKKWPSEKSQKALPTRPAHPDPRLEKNLRRHLRQPLLFPQQSSATVHCYAHFSRALSCTGGISQRTISRWMSCPSCSRSLFGEPRRRPATRPCRFWPTVEPWRCWDWGCARRGCNSRMRHGILRRPTGSSLHGLDPPPTPMAAEAPGSSGRGEWSEAGPGIYCCCSSPSFANHHSATGGISSTTAEPARGLLHECLCAGLHMDQGFGDDLGPLPRSPAGGDYTSS